MLFGFGVDWFSTGLALTGVSGVVCSFWASWEKAAVAVSSEIKITRAILEEAIETSRSAFRSLRSWQGIHETAGPCNGIVGWGRPLGLRCRRTTQAFPHPTGRHEENKPPQQHGGQRLTRPDPESNHAFDYCSITFDRCIAQARACRGRSTLQARLIFFLYGKLHSGEINPRLQNALIGFHLLDVAADSCDFLLGCEDVLHLAGTIAQNVQQSFLGGASIFHPGGAIGELLGHFFARLRFLFDAAELLQFCNC